MPCNVCSGSGRLLQDICPLCDGLPGWPENELATRPTRTSKRVRSSIEALENEDLQRVSASAARPGNDHSSIPLKTLLAEVAKLPYDFPPGTEAVQLKSLPLAQHEQVARMAAAVTPICVVAVCHLLHGFLTHKRMRGSPVEQELYAKTTVPGLFTRLLRNRPVSFWGTGDRYILATPTTVIKRHLQSEQWGGFEEVGGERECAPLLLEDYLSYDEMQMSALISVAVPTLFINDGDRASECKPGKPGSFQESGVMVGCVGARMVKAGRMEAEHMLVTPTSDTARGYGPREHANGGLLSVWARFYGVSHLPCYEEAAAAAAAEGDGRYYRIPHEAHCQCCHKAHEEVWTDAGRQYCASCMMKYYGTAPAQPPDSPSYLDGFVYKRRIRATVEPFLEYASQLGAAHRTIAGHGAHVRVKGLGLGAWWVDPVQEDLMKQVYEEVLAERTLSGIDVLEFAYFPSEDVPAGSGTIHVKTSKCGFAEPVGNCLLVAMYAWDGNAHAGNEWWAESGSGKYLGMTDDSAAASCSLITSLQHPVVNAQRHCAAAALALTRNGMQPGFVCECEHEHV